MFEEFCVRNCVPLFILHVSDQTGAKVNLDAWKWHGKQMASEQGGTVCI